AAPVGSVRADGVRPPITAQSLAWRSVPGHAPSGPLAALTRATLRIRSNNPRLRGRPAAGVPGGRPGLVNLCSMTNGSPSETPSAGVVDLLGLLAYAELVSFFRLSGDAGLAPDLAAKGELAGAAAAEYRHYRLLHDR